MAVENNTPEKKVAPPSGGMGMEEGEMESGGLTLRRPEEGVLLASSAQGKQNERAQQVDVTTPDYWARYIKAMLEGRVSTPISELPAMLRRLNSSFYERLNSRYSQLYPTDDGNHRGLIRDLFNHFRQDQGSALWRSILVELARLEEPEDYSPNPTAGFVDGNLNHTIPSSDPQRSINSLGNYLVGQKISTDLFWINAVTKEELGNGRNLMMQVRSPRGQIIQRFGPGDRDVDFTPTEAGVYDVIVVENVPRRGVSNAYYDVARVYFTVHTQEGVATQSLQGVAPVSYEDLKTRMLVQDLALGGYGVQDQQVGSAYLSSSLENPLRPKSGLFGGYQPQTATYTAHGIGGTADQRVRWYVAMENKPELAQQYPGLVRASTDTRNRLKVPPDRALYFMDVTAGLTKNFEIKAPGQYLIYGEEYTVSSGRATGKIARYFQSALSDEQDKARESFRTYQGNVAARMAQMQPGREIPLKAVHMDEKQARTQLTMYLGPARDGGLLLVDATPVAREMDFRGRDFSSLLADFQGRSSTYPKGMLFLEIPQNNIGVQSGRHIINTDGESNMGLLARATGWLSLIAAGAGVVALVVPGGQVVAPFLFMGSSALGAASAGASLADQADNASVDKAGVALDVLTIATSLIGLGAAASAARGGGNALLGGTRMGRYVLFTNFALEGASALVLTYDSVVQIRAISENAGMSPEEKRNAIVRLVANLAVTGGLFVLSARDLQMVRQRGLQPDADPANPLAPSRNLSQLPPNERIAEFQDMINRVRARIETEPKFRVIYSDLEMADTAILGRQLGLSDQEIEDFLFVGQRSEAAKPEKTLTIEEVHRQMNNWANVVRPRGYPYLFGSLESFNRFKADVRTALRRYSIPDHTVRIQGSSLRTEAAKDIDMAVFVTRQEFDNIVARARAGIEARHSGSDAASQGKRRKFLRELESQAETGRLNSYYFDRVPGSPTTFNQELYETRQHLIDPNKSVDLSVMLEGANFSVSPFLTF